MLPAPTITELADFTGRPASTFGTFATVALTQATLMFQTLTKLTAYPDNPDLTQLAKFAIVEMADRILLEQPYSQVKSSPFQTETIGSYSYSKTTPTSKTALQGSRTGLFWWDIAIDELSLPGSSPIGHGSIAVNNEELVRDGDGGWFLLDADQVDGPDRPPYIRIS